MMVMKILFRGDNSDNKRYRLSIILTIIALVLWSFSITQATLDIGYFGIIYGFPIIFFIALILLSIASFLLWRSSKDHSILLAFQTFILLVSLWLIPIAIGASFPREAHATDKFIRYTSYVVEEGHLSDEISYHTYPAMWILGTVTFKLFGIESHSTIISIARLGPFIAQLLTLPIVYLFLRKFLKNENRNWIFCGIWVFNLSAWTGYNRLDPQALGLILLLLALFLLPIRVDSEENARQGYAKNLMLVVFTFTLAFTHLLTTIMLSITAIALFLSRNLRSLFLPVMIIALALTWLIHQGIALSEDQLPDFADRMLRLDLLFELFSEPTTSQGNASHLAIAQIRTVTTVLFVSIAAVSLAATWHRGIGKRSSIVILVIIAGAIATGGAMFYGTEVLQRAWWFMLAPISYLIMNLLNFKKLSVIILILIIIALPLFFISYYGNQEQDYVSPSDRAGNHFAEEHIETGTIMTALPSVAVVPFNLYFREYQIKNFEELDVGESLPDDYILEAWINSAILKPYYLVTGRAAEEWYRAVYDNIGSIQSIEEYFKEDGLYNVIYTSGDFRIYNHS
ncbi:hypothetical protein ACFLTQ_01015 [Chloroflexota bacterium]